MFGTRIYSRRSFLKQAGLSAAMLGMSGYAVAKPARNRPNILFICTDYQAGDDGPTLGSPFLDMPALKRLCDEGVVFERHYSTSPICIPARYTWVSGRYPHFHKNWDNWGIWFEDGTPILMDELTKSGYDTIGIGKMHFNPWDRMAGFKRRIIADCKGASWKEDDYGKFLKSKGFKYNRLDYCPEVKWEIPEVYDWQWDESLHIDAYVGDQTLKVIENDELTGPWFMWVSFNGPHNPWNPPAKYSDPYKKMPLPKANSRRGELNEKPTDHTRVRYNYTRNVPDYIDQHPESHDAVIHRIRAGHYGGLTFIDRQIEKILAALEAKNMLDDTIVIFSADHGCHLGDHENIHKGTHYRRSAHVPFVVRCPKRYKPRRTKAFSSHVDLMPTLLSLASVPAPETMEGKDLSPIFDRTKESVQDHVFIEVRHTVSIVTDRWKFGIHLKDHDGDLYDLRNDPGEQKNLFDDPAYADVQTELLGRIFKFYPEHKETLAKNPYQPFVEKDEYTLKQGVMLKDAEAPYQAEKTIRIHADIAAKDDQPMAGPVVVADAGPHGYAIYIADGKIFMTVRRWGKTVQFDGGPIETKATIDAVYDRSGKLTLMIDGKKTAEGVLDGPIPKQTGRKAAVCGWTGVGKVHQWHHPMGKYDKKISFCGTISNATIKLS